MANASAWYTIGPANQEADIICRAAHSHQRERTRYSQPQTRLSASAWNLTVDSLKQAPTIPLCLPDIFKVKLVGSNEGGNHRRWSVRSDNLQAHEQFSIQPIEAILFESEERIGGTFWYRTYQDAELVSSRQLTCFSDFRISDDEPDFVSTERYCAYLDEYCTKFGLWKHIKLSTRVSKVRRRQKGGHVVSYIGLHTGAVEEWICDALAICSGLHVTPNLPTIPGAENIPRTLHSSEFKHFHQFGSGQHVLICGAGETSMDLAYLAIQSDTRSVTLCRRSRWQNAPKRVFPEPVRKGNVEEWKKVNARLGPMPPTDTCSPSLFDTMYVHPVLERSSLLWDYYDAFTKGSVWFISGTTAGLDQWVGGIPKERFHSSKIIPNKSNKAMPFISAPYRPKVQSKGQHKMSQIIGLPPFDTRGRIIELAPWPERVDESGRVFFQNTSRPETEGMKHVECRPDLIVYATGYNQIFPFLDETYAVPETANIRRIWREGDEDVAFIGFVRPNFGAIPPLAELQAQCWVAQLCKALPRPLQEDLGFYLRDREDRRIPYAVDHDSYAYRLACDTGSAASLLQVASYGPTVFLTWAIGPNFNTKFRLTGPWEWEGASGVMRTEWWHVIRRRRGWFVWVFLTIVPMGVFGPISFLLWIVYSVVGAGQLLIY